MNTNRLSDALVNVMSAAYIDWPAAAAQLWLTGNHAPFESAGRTAYDAAVDFANEWTDQIYCNLLFARFFGVAFETSFIMEQLLEGRSLLDSRPLEPYVEVDAARAYANGHDRKTMMLHPH